MFVVNGVPVRAWEHVSFRVLDRNRSASIVYWDWGSPMTTSNDRPRPTRPGEGKW